MGAEQYEVTASGATVEQAFAAAREKALYDYGHRGYTGTIAEKDEFVVLEAPPTVEPAQFVKWVMDGGYHVDLVPAEHQEAIKEAIAQVDDKWGPSGATKIADGEWIFYGFASS
jgi:hypothetical protein